MQEDIVEKIANYLEDICGDSSERLLNEVEVYGDTEVESIFFLEIIGMLEEDMGINIPVKEVHKRVKSSFRDFCTLVGELLEGK
ncbi:acyl carrier protein [Neobacillus soli]|uniref:acyl carrier protein n=1 Tax=Neobacillus soli TaxID=220688 RepID=UPI0008261054|nr:acyl carrier protein [Neobacillus soli]